MTPTRDIVARRRARTALVVALLALIAALGAYSVQAYADSVTEPDAYALQQQVVQLQDQVDELTGLVADQQDTNDVLFENDGVLDQRTATSDCLAYSDYHYVRERINGGKKRWRMPLVVWRMDVPTCRADPKRQWKPTRRAHQTLTLEAPHAR